MVYPLKFCYIRPKTPISSYEIISCYVTFFCYIMLHCNIFLKKPLYIKDLKCYIFNSLIYKKIEQKKPKM